METVLHFAKQVATWAPAAVNVAAAILDEAASLEDKLPKIKQLLGPDLQSHFDSIRAAVAMVKKLLDGGLKLEDLESGLKSLTSLQAPPVQ